MSVVKELNDADFRAAIAAQTLAVVDVFASWCGPCRLFSPIFEEVAQLHVGKIAFFKIDGDENPVCRSDLTIDNLPFVAAYRHGQFVKGISTSTEAGLNEFLESL